MQLKFFRQEGREEGTCGPRSLQIALSAFGYYPPFQDIYHLCGTAEDGTFLFELPKAARALGCRVVVRTRKASSAAIKKYVDRGNPVLVNWFADDTEGSTSDHCAVAYRVSDTYIYLLDPAAFLYVEPTLLIKRTSLDKCWLENPGSRWMMAITAVAKKEQL